MSRGIITLIIILLISCGSENIARKELPEVELKRALEVYQNEDYEEAKNLLYAITIKHTGTKIAEDAQFYLAECYFKTDKFLVSANAYQQIVDRYRRSNYLEEAQYKEAKSYYLVSPGFALDQKFTHIAIRKYNSFIRDWNESKFKEVAEKERSELQEKLAEKDYEGILTYYKMSKFRAALQYADVFLNKHRYSNFVESVYLLKARIYIGKEEPIKAEQEIQLLLAKFPNFKKDEDFEDLLAEIEDEKEKKRSKI